MKTIADPAALEQLVERMKTLARDSRRKWGTLTVGEMLCHLGDAAESVIARGASEKQSETPTTAPSRPIFKWIGLRLPLSWPRGLETPPSVDPHAEGTRPSDFEADRARAIAALRALATAAPDALATSHGAFGKMTTDDWHRWAHRRTDHHLRRFGVWPRSN